MKGLASLPTRKELRLAYAELERIAMPTLESASATLWESRVATLSQWARLDARLAELLTGSLLRRWSEIQALALLRELSLQPWPRAILVPLRFVEIALRAGAGDLTGGERALGEDFGEDQLAKLDRLALRHLIEAIEEAFPATSEELYFIPLQRMNRVLVAEAVDYLSSPYEKSGYVGSAWLLSKSILPMSDLEGESTTLDHRARARVLREVVDQLHDGDSITVDDYMERCRFQVSRRQAQRDLARCEQLRAVGFTRGLRYTKISVAKARS